MKVRVTHDIAPDRLVADSEAKIPCRLVERHDGDEPGQRHTIAAETHCLFARQRLAQPLRQTVDLHTEFTLECRRIDLLVADLRDCIVAEAGEDVGNAPNRKGDHQKADNAKSDDTGCGFPQTVEHDASFSPAPLRQGGSIQYRNIRSGPFRPPRIRAA